MYKQYMVWIIILVLFLSFVWGVNAENGPSYVDVEKIFSKALPSYWELTSFNVTASESAGTKVRPIWYYRFKATVKLIEDTFEESRKIYDATFIIRIRKMGESKELYGIATATLKAEQWNLFFDLEENLPVNIGKPRSAFSGKTVVEGTNEEKEFKDNLVSKLGNKNIPDREQIARALIILGDEYGKKVLTQILIDRIEVINASLMKSGGVDIDLYYNHFYRYVEELGSLSQPEAIPAILNAYKYQGFYDTPRRYAKEAILKIGKPGLPYLKRGVTELQQWYFSNESRAYHKLVYGRELTNEELFNLSWGPIYVSRLIQELEPGEINNFKDTTRGPIYVSPLIQELEPGEITKFKDTTISTVQLSGPSNGSTLPLGDITFSWNFVSNATKYQFIIYNSQGQVTRDAVDSGTSSIVNLSIKKKTASSATGTWKVRAGDNSGNWGAWSTTWSFTLKSTTPINTDSSPQILYTNYFLTGSLHCPDKRGYPCNSCSSAPGYVNHFKGFNVLTTNEDCYVRLTYNDGDYIGNQNNCEVTIKGEKWLGLENGSGTKLVEQINNGSFEFEPANEFVEKIMKIPGNGYNCEFANEGKEFRLYLPRNREEAFKAVPWKNITVEIKNKETDKVFKYKFSRGIFPRAYSWSNGGVTNYGQCVWWTAKIWVEEVDSKTLFPFYPPSPEAVNVKTIDSNYQPEKYDVLINYNTNKVSELGHYGFVEKVEGDKVYISQFNWIKPGEVYNHVPMTWNGNATNFFYSNNFYDEYYFKYYYRK